MKTSQEKKEALCLFLEADPGMDQALGALRDSQVEPEAPSERRVEISVIRSWRLERDLRSFRWWMPVLCAAAAAVAGMLALLQLSTMSEPRLPDAPAASAEWPSYSESGD